jgi:sulfur carrier protein ThiS adenylyltransferase
MGNLSEYTPTVIGCGAIGSQVAQQLVQIGSDVRLIDFDDLAVENLAPQGFREADIGKPKVEALAQRLAEFNSEVNIEIINGRFRKSEGKKYDTIFCCVDSMESRKFIFEATKKYFDFFVDGRMRGGSELRILVAQKSIPESIEHYQDPANLFTDAQASDGSCTAKTTIYGAYAISAMMVGQYVRWINNQPMFFYDVMMDLGGLDTTSLASVF